MFGAELCTNTNSQATLSTTAVVGWAAAWLLVRQKIGTWICSFVSSYEGKVVWCQIGGGWRRQKDDRHPERTRREKRGEKIIRKTSSFLMLKRITGSKDILSDSRAH